MAVLVMRNISTEPISSAQSIVSLHAKRMLFVRCRGSVTCSRDFTTGSKTCLESARIDRSRIVRARGSGERVGVGATADMLVADMLKERLNGLGAGKGEEVEETADQGLRLL